MSGENKKAKPLRAALGSLEPSGFYLRATFTGGVFYLKRQPVLHTVDESTDPRKVVVGMSLDMSRALCELPTFEPFASEEAAAAALAEFAELSAQCGHRMSVREGVTPAPIVAALSEGARIQRIEIVECTFREFVWMEAVVEPPDPRAVWTATDPEQHKRS